LPSELDRPLPAPLPRDAHLALVPTVHAAAVAVGGFLAGAAMVGLVHRLRRSAAAPRTARRARRRAVRARLGSKASPRAPQLVQIVGSRSLLVDVHLLGER
jgi:hypothetical protein